MSTSLLRTFSACVCGITLLAGCQFPWLGKGGAQVAPSLTLGFPKTLLQPQGMDWTTERVSSPLLERERADYFRDQAAQQRHVQAWPGAASGWSPSGTYPGVSLTTLGCAAGDSVPNGPATAFYGNTVPSTLENQIFFLTKNGMFLKVDKYNPTTSHSALNLGTTFSKTNVTLSFSCRRAYCLADNGTLFIVDTQTMTKLATLSVAGGYGIAPVIDPETSRSDDQREELWVPDNAGNVTHYTITAPNNPPGPFSVSAPTTYSVATGNTPIAGSWNPSNYKIASPAYVYNGVIYVGDEAGNLDVYDTNNTANNVTYAIATTGIEATPALEFQDGTYTGLTDALGNPVTVPVGTPIYAFVNAQTRNGPVCVWVNLENQSATDSLPLYCDDNDKGRKADYLLNYNYRITNVTTYLAAQDGGNVAMDGNNLPTAYTQPWSNTYLEPAQTDLTSPTASANYPANNQPTGLTFDSSGDIWVTNQGANEVTVLNSSGTILATYATGNHPMGIALDPASGNLWVANQGSDTISLINVSSGVTSAVVTSFSTGAGSQPTGLAVDASGNVWVANQGANTVAEYSSAGTLLKTVAVGTKPDAVAIDSSGNIGVTNNGSNTVSELNSSGTVVGTVSSGTAPNNKQPMAIAADSLGDGWVCDFGSNCVVELSPTGTVLKTLTVQQPQGIAIDASDNVWVTSKSNNQVLEFSNSGTSLNTLTTLNQPYGVDVGPAGTAVADFGSNDITLTNAPGGGPVYTFLRFTDSKYSTYTAGSSIQSATLSLTTNNTSQSCYPPEIWDTGAFNASGTTGVFYKGTSTLWQSNGGLTAANAPTVVSNIGSWIGGGINGQGIANFNSNHQFNWDVTAGIGGHLPGEYYAFAVKYDPSLTKGNNVYYPGGPLTAHTNGNKAPFYTPQFQNNALNANPATPTHSNDTRPLLTLKIGIASLIPTGPVESMPIVDSMKHKVYVQDVNYLYCVDYSNTTAWTDAAYSPSTNTGTMYTTYNTLYWGTNGGATIDNKTNFVSSNTTPLMAFDTSAMYCYNYYPSGGKSTDTTFKAALTKILLPLSPGTDRQSPNTGSPGTQVSNTLTSGTTLLSNSAASAYMILDPYLNTSTSGGGVYIGLTGTNMVYQFSP